MRKGVIIFISALVMILASVSLFGQYGRGYGRGDGYGRGYGRGDGYGRGYGRCGEGYRYNNSNYRGNYNGCYYYTFDNNQLAK